METRTQRYAKAAYAKVATVQNQAVEKKYGALALNFPVMVLQGGLAQATGFLLAKAKEEHTAYLNDLAAVLQEGDGKTFHEKIIRSDVVTYQRLTRSTLDAAAWMKRYAQGLLKADPTEGGQS